MCAHGNVGLDLPLPAVSALSAVPGWTPLLSSGESVSWAQPFLSWQSQVLEWQRPTGWAYRLRSSCSSKLGGHNLWPESGLAFCVQ